MIEGKGRFSLALRAASGILGSARTMVIAVVAIAFSLTMVTKAQAVHHRPPTPAGPGGSSGVPLPNPEPLEDAILVDNYGDLFGGSWLVWPAGQKGGNFKPTQNVAGSKTTLIGPTGIASGPALLGFPVYVDVVAANGVFQFAVVSNQNTGPEGAVIGPLTGIDAPFGITFGSTGPGPFEESTISDGMWVTNGAVQVFKTPPFGAPCSVGTITVFNPFNPNPDQVPQNNHAVLQANGAPINSTIGGCNTGLLLPVGIAVHSEAVALNTATKSKPAVSLPPEGAVYVVNYALAPTPAHGKTPASPGLNGYLLVFEPGETGYGNVTPVGAFGAPGQTGTQNILIKPEYIALQEGVSLLAASSKSNAAVAPEDDILAVTDIGDDSIKFFSAAQVGPEVVLTFLGSIVGPQTRLHTPMGIAAGFGGDDYYVANQSTAAVTFYDLDSPVGTGTNFPPSAIIQGDVTSLNLPTGVAIDVPLEPAVL
ncbi:MAG TPA: hypothetical protein VIX59_01535 [Candidatus Binataceae bacterium]